MVIKILIEHTCSSHMGSGECACSWRASQFVVLIFKNLIDSLTKLNILMGRDREVRVGPLKTF